jgi:hypothetical protein
MRTNEKDLSRLRDAVAAAKDERARLAAEAEQLDGAERELNELSADEFLGTIPPDAYQRRRADLDGRRRDLRDRRQRVDATVATLARRASELAEQIARDRQAEIEARPGR